MRQTLKLMWLGHAVALGLASLSWSASVYAHTVSRPQLTCHVVAAGHCKKKKRSETAFAETSRLKVLAKRSMSCRTEKLNKQQNPISCRD